MPPFTVLWATLWQFVPTCLTRKRPLVLPVGSNVNPGQRGWGAVVAFEETHEVPDGAEEE